MATIKTLNKIANAGLKLLNDYTIIDENDNRDYEGIILRSYKLHDFEFSKNLCAIARAGAGVNNVPVEQCSKEGIVVFNTPGANANGVKELVILGLLVASRNVVKAATWTSTLKGQIDISKKVEKEKSKFVGPEIKGKRLGVIGLGAIGAMVANAGISLGMEVSGYDPFITVDSAWNLDSSVKNVKTIEEIYAESDYITIHVPLMEQTKNLIDQAAISHMKPGVKILNFSRNGLVDDQALIKALADNKVSAYVTDFPTEEIIDVENVIAIPHLGASTPESEINCAVMAAQQIKDYIENGNIKHSVNYPNADMGVCSGQARICILHKNIPNMIGNITKAVGNSQVNIKDMLNKSRADYAYTIIDVDSPIDSALKQELEGLAGVLRVRLLK